MMGETLFPEGKLRRTDGGYSTEKSPKHHVSMLELHFCAGNEDLPIRVGPFTSVETSQMC